MNELNLSLLLRSGGEWALHFWPITTLHSTSVGNPSVVVLYYIILYYQQIQISIGYDLILPAKKKNMILYFFFLNWNDL